MIKLLDENPNSNKKEIEKIISSESNNFIDVVENIDEETKKKIITRTAKKRKEVVDAVISGTNERDQLIDVMMDYVVHLHGKI